MMLTKIEAGARVERCHVEYEARIRKIKRTATSFGLIPIALFFTALFMPGCDATPGGPVAAGPNSVLNMYFYSFWILFAGYIVAGKSPLLGIGLITATLAFYTGTLLLLITPVLARLRVAATSPAFYIFDLLLACPIVAALIDLTFNRGRFFRPGFRLLALAFFAQIAIMNWAVWKAERARNDVFLALR